jgi:hypothetical protein
MVKGQIWIKEMGKLFSKVQAQITEVNSYMLRSQRSFNHIRFHLIEYGISDILGRDFVYFL